MICLKNILLTRCIDFYNKTKPRKQNNSWSQKHHRFVPALFLRMWVEVNFLVSWRELYDTFFIVLGCQMTLQKLSFQTWFHDTCLLKGVT